MSFLKKKSLIVTLITLLSVVCVLFASLGICLYQNKSRGKGTKAADLTISNYSQLKAFAEDVNSGNSYSGKTVVLANSINCIIHDIGTIYTKQDLPCIGSGSWNSFSGGTINSFNGTFDGQGYSIYNFNLVGGATFRTQSIKDQKAYNYYYNYHVALFVDIGSSATIKNVKIYDYSIQSMTHVDTPTGGAHSYYHYDKNAALVSNYNNRGTISQCWINGSGTAYIGSFTVKDVMLPSSIINSSGGTVSSPYTTSGLTSVSSTGGEDGSIWYYAADYNGGWPVLRIFLNRNPGWKSVSFTVTGGTAPSSIYIPSDANKTYSSTTSSITIYGQTVSATSSYCHYETSGWSATSSTSYSISFTKPTRTINIKIYDETSGSTSIFKTYTLVCGSTISLSYIGYSGTNKYKSCTISGYIYVPSTLYYISAISCSNGTVIHSNQDIIITIKLKTYDITIS